MLDKVKNIFVKLKKDSWILGISMGIILPAIILGIFYPLNEYLGNFHYGLPFLKKSTIFVLAIFSNLLPFRYYMVKLNFDKTGRGILLDTFIFAGIFFYFYLR